ncbi:MAG: hypothetical protein LUC88_00225, partial [Prevotella sp.]|nr:hypothetical protein [Prevotella sp.]
ILTSYMRKIKNITRNLIVSIILFFMPSIANGQENKGWIVGLYTHSNNTYIDLGMNIVNQLVGIPLSHLTDGISTVDQSFVCINYISMTDNGDEIGYKMANPYGFTSYDLFNDLEAGVKFGWQGPTSPIGAYIYCAYGMNQYDLLFLGDREYHKHKLQSLRLGLRVRISPLYYLLEDYEWCPIIELGTTYVDNFNYRGPNDNDIQQINNGLRTCYAIGVQKSNFDFMICFDMAHYDIFNKKYTSDGGFWYPYANFKNKDMSFSLRFNYRFGED